MRALRHPARGVHAACVLLLAAFFAASCPAQRIPVYLGTGAEGDEAGIYRTELDVASGALTEPVRIAAEPGAGFLALHPGGRFLYATARAGGEGMVASFRIAADGHLVRLNRQPSGGHGPCHVAVDPTGRLLMVSNYGDGRVAALAIRPDGALRQPWSVHQHEGSSADPRRQEGPHAHAAIPGPRGDFAFVADLGTDEVRVYGLQPGAAMLDPLEGATARLAPGAGPRHLAFGARGDVLYVVEELTCGIAALRWDAGARSFEAAGRSFALGRPMRSEDRMTSSEVALAPDGRHLYCANRDLTGEGRDSLTVFDVGADGRLSNARSVPAGVWIPRHFAIEPGGRWLLVAGQKEGAVVVFRVDPETGDLAPTPHRIRVPAAMCVVYPQGRRQ